LIVIEFFALAQRRGRFRRRFQKISQHFVAKSIFKPRCRRMGFASLNPSYALLRIFFAAIRKKRPFHASGRARANAAAAKSLAISMACNMRTNH